MMMVTMCVCLCVSVVYNITCYFHLVQIFVYLTKKKMRAVLHSVATLERASKSIARKITLIFDAAIAHNRDLQN